MDLFPVGLRDQPRRDGDLTSAKGGRNRLIGRQGGTRTTYIVASSWRKSGNRFDNAGVDDNIGLVGGILQPPQARFHWE